MAKANQKNHHQADSQQYVYRGRQIEINKSDAREKLDHERIELLIDGYPIELEQTEHGVTSHALMFQEFSSPQELAEALVKQWGNAQPEPVQPQPPHHDHH